MDIEDLQKICKSLPGSTEDIKWENHLCYCIGGKMYISIGLDHSPVTSSFKVKEEDFEELSAREGLAPAPYLARYKWVWTSDINLLSREEWDFYIQQSYELVKNKLPKKIRRELKLE